MSQSKSKPYAISKHLVLEAWRRVKANDGAPGVDRETMEDFERALKDNLYRLWNRMSSGSYFPEAVRAVSIPKQGGGERKLGIPTVRDRVAQMIAKMHLEPELEPHFHADSYGYRPAKSAHDALGQARQRCWKYDWVVDLDIKGFFDNISHELLLKAVRKHAKQKWVVLYIERWLKAPVQEMGGELVAREKGTPQGGVISPLLANLFLHYALDRWLVREHPGNPFERYADDGIVHCRSQEEAERIRRDIAERMTKCGLELNAEKTKVVYCKDSDRKGTHEHEKFTFLGYEFRPRRAKNYRGKYFVSFLPAVSDRAGKAIREEMRGWRIPLRSDKSLEDLSRMFNAVIRGWAEYYGRYYRSMLHPIFRGLDRLLVWWACRKYKRLRRHRRRAAQWLARISRREPRLWAHWAIGVRVMV